MDDCIALARQLGERVGDELGIPGLSLRARGDSSDTRESRRRSTRTIRGTARRARLESRARSRFWAAARFTRSAGAVAIGARPFLVAYNVYLGDAANLPLAKSIAKGSSRIVRRIQGRQRTGPGSRRSGAGLDEPRRHRADCRFTCLRFHLGARRRRTERDVTWSEIIGLVPERVLFDSAKDHLKLAQFTADQVLERQVARAMRASDGCRPEAPSSHDNSPPRHRRFSRRSHHPIRFPAAAASLLRGSARRGADTYGRRPHPRKKEIRGGGTGDRGDRSERRGAAWSSRGS